MICREVNASCSYGSELRSTFAIHNTSRSFCARPIFKEGFDDKGLYLCWQPRWFFGCKMDSDCIRYSKPGQVEIYTRKLLSYKLYITWRKEQVVGPQAYKDGMNAHCTKINLINELFLMVFVIFSVPQVFSFKSMWCKPVYVLYMRQRAFCSRIVPHSVACFSMWWKWRLC